MGGPEASLVRRVLRTVNSWPQTRAVKMHGSRFGRHGDPDIWGCRYGRMFLLEMKAPGEKPTPSQYSELRKWERAGAATEWADNFDDAVAFVRKIT
jgi:hypothetical protein